MSTKPVNIRMKFLIKTGFSSKSQQKVRLKEALECVHIARHSHLAQKQDEKSRNIVGASEDAPGKYKRFYS